VRASSKRTARHIIYGSLSPHQAGAANPAHHETVASGQWNADQNPTATEMSDGDFSNDHLLERAKHDFLRLAESYAWLNPALTLRLSWNGEQVSTSRHQIRNGGSGCQRGRQARTGTTRAAFADTWRHTLRIARAITVARVHQRVSRHDRYQPSKNWCWAETGASHVSLHNYFGIHKPTCQHREAARLGAEAHESRKAGRPWHYRQGSSVPHDGAGRRYPATFTYNRRIGETNGVPRVMSLLSVSIERVFLLPGEYHPGRSSPV